MLELIVEVFAHWPTVSSEWTRKRLLANSVIAMFLVRVYLTHPLPAGKEPSPPDADDEVRTKKVDERRFLFHDDRDIVRIIFEKSISAPNEIFRTFIRSANDCSAFCNKVTVQRNVNMNKPG